MQLNVKLALEKFVTYLRRFALPKVCARVASSGLRFPLYLEVNNLI